MVEELGIGLPQMMENAGRALADLALRRFQPATVLVLAGPGGNGGGGLVAARHLANRGSAVRIALSETGLTPVTAMQLDILRRMGVEEASEPRAADLVVDAIIGYSLRGDPRERAAGLIRWTRTAAVPVLSLDTPSGLDVTTGRAGTPCVRADATLTLALPKRGLLLAPEVGELYLGDISVPPLAYTRLGVQVPNVFAEDTVVRLTITSGE
jgi:NAD(P)H-hydrate epimerase